MIRADAENFGVFVSAHESTFQLVFFKKYTRKFIPFISFIFVEKCRKIMYKNEFLT